MLAERLPGLLPDLDLDAAIEVTAIHSVAGVLPPGMPLVSRPPFRGPHHSATPAALVGAGSTVLRPGLACQAHRGILFLDEAPEFQRPALDALRQPLESGVIEIARARATTRFPARFLLVWVYVRLDTVQSTSVGRCPARSRSEVERPRLSRPATSNSGLIHDGTPGAPAPSHQARASCGRAADGFPSGSGRSWIVPSVMRAVPNG